MLSGHEFAREQLDEISAASDGSVQVQDESRVSESWAQFDVSIRFDGHQRAAGGLPVRARELFLVFVPSTFPFEYPRVAVPHLRFAGFPHVQWGSQLCLYGSAVQWLPEAGMRGFIERLDRWVRDAAMNNLDPDDQPLHPPVAYPSVNRLVIPRVNAPLVETSPWIGIAEICERGRRTEIVGWRSSSEAQSVRSAIAVLLHRRMPFEYPETVKSLLDELSNHGVEYATIILDLAAHANNSDDGEPLLVVVGAPMRRLEAGGPNLQHLAVWEISGEDADKLRRLQVAIGAGDARARDSAIQKVVDWSASAKVGWCRVSEMRSEVTIRRDHASPMAWFHGKRIAIWGCGAVGTRVAESVVRAGVAEVELVDFGIVTPGLLVRQGFEDDDVGLRKSVALANRLKRIEPYLRVNALTVNLITRIDDPDAFSGFDLIVDCTASSAVRMKLERHLSANKAHLPIASMGISGDASSAIASLSHADHSGGPMDLYRRLKLEGCRRSNLSSILDAFWAKESTGEDFQPEPGCSEPTFVGSDADLAALAARLLNAIASELSDPKDGKTGFGCVFEAHGATHTFHWRPDVTVEESEMEYSVRVSPEAVREMRTWAKRSARTAGSEVETGGLAFGELNEAAGVLWVTEVEGPPPDSSAAVDHFTCGIAGMAEAAEHKCRRYRGSVVCVGSWHTHPTSLPIPSDIDISAVIRLLGAPNSTRRSFALLILSGNTDAPILGVQTSKVTAKSRRSICIEFGPEFAKPIRQVPVETRNVGLALSGGGSRAIAFHLGCFRALNDLGVLNRVQVISSVSGGSIISALYAYSNCTFREFDARVVALLRQGLVKGISREVLRPSEIATAVSDLFESGFRNGLSHLSRIFPSELTAQRLSKSQSKRTRRISRADAFRSLMASYFESKLVRDVSRDSLDVVINATELSTGSAFRFGSQNSGSWRFGTIDPKDAFVADAVAASAAYPMLLPALDKTYRFSGAGPISDPKRVLLSDGGLFDNLGVSPMFPGRNPSISTNVFNPDFIIACDAGPGLLDGKAYPNWWPNRVRRSFEITFRKAQDSSRARLHSLADSGAISGFALPYLGQDDHKLPWMPPELPSRSEVWKYPTDFWPMQVKDIDLLALRGEILTRLLVANYLPHM